MDNAIQATRRGDRETALAFYKRVGTRGAREGKDSFIPAFSDVDKLPLHNLRKGESILLVDAKDGRACLRCAICSTMLTSSKKVHVVRHFLSFGHRSGRNIKNVRTPKHSAALIRRNILCGQQKFKLRQFYAADHEKIGELIQDSVCVALCKKGASFRVMTLCLTMIERAILTLNASKLVPLTELEVAQSKGLTSIARLAQSYNATMKLRNMGSNNASGDKRGVTLSDKGVSRRVERLGNRVLQLKRDFLKQCVAVSVMLDETSTRSMQTAPMNVVTMGILPSFQGWGMFFVGTADTGSCHSADDYFSRFKEVYQPCDCWETTVALGTDGCATMGASSLAGVNAKRRGDNLCEKFRAHLRAIDAPFEPYMYHSICHVLNLCVADTLKRVLPPHFMKFVRSLVSYFRRSAKRTSEYKKAGEDIANDLAATNDRHGWTLTRLASYCPTRWTGMHTTCQSINKNVKVLKQLRSQRISEGYGAPNELAIAQQKPSNLTVNMVRTLGRNAVIAELKARCLHVEGRVAQLRARLILALSSIGDAVGPGELDEASSSTNRAPASPARRRSRRSNAGVPALRLDDEPQAGSVDREPDRRIADDAACPAAQHIRASCVPRALDETEQAMVVERAMLQLVADMLSAQDVDEEPVLASTKADALLSNLTGATDANFGLSAMLEGVLQPYVQMVTRLQTVGQPIQHRVSGQLRLFLRTVKRDFTGDEPTYPACYRKWRNEMTARALGKAPKSKLVDLVDNIAARFVGTLVEEVNRRLERCLPHYNAFELIDPLGAPKVAPESWLAVKDVCNRYHLDYDSVRRDILDVRGKEADLPEGDRQKCRQNLFMFYQQKCMEGQGWFGKDLLQFAKYVFVQPVENCACESSFSTMLYNKSAVRNQLRDQTAAHIMHLHAVTNPGAVGPSDTDAFHRDFMDALILPVRTHELPW